MKNLLVPVAIALASISIARASVPAPLNSVRTIRSLTSAEAAQGLPVAFEATVTFFRGERNNLFVQDGKDAIYVQATTGAKLVPGDRVLVKGTTLASFRNIVLSNDITLLGHGALPKPVPATFNDLIRGRYDAMLVTTRGVVRSADMNLPTAAHEADTTLRVLLDGGDADVEVDGDDANALSGLLDADVEITGVAGGKFDGKMQLTGISLHAASPANIRILKPAAASPWAIPVTPMDDVLKTYHVRDLTPRVRVQGTMTYYVPGSAIVLQSGTKSLWIRTLSSAPMRIGDLADATGFPSVNEGFLTLIGSEIQDDQTQAPIVPQPLGWRELSSSKHLFDLVSTEGEVVMEAREGSQDEYVLESNGYLFSAIYRHPVAAGATSLAPMRQVPVGSRIRVTGICVLDDSNPFNRNVPFNILMRTPDDIAVVAKPSLLTVRNLGALVIFLLLAMLVVGARAWYIDRTMRAHVATLGYLVQRRGLILEDINNARPLAGILERITELASFSLKGAPCWCQIADGARLGNCPPQLSASGLRIAEHTIAARSGPALGSIFAAFDAHTSPQAEEKKTLSAAAGLATLAIETSRLHADLVHRSEFDLLTDIQNRFSFEKHLNSLIVESRQTAGIFGLIYIDVDDFKQVNDHYGHLVGDLYLQQMAERMMRQVRPGDLLARLGGDEFGVLVSVVHNRSDVEEIALRLERSFDEPFVVQGNVLHGSASFGIALYPEDAANNDALLSAADAAMYAAKNARKAKARIPAGQPDCELTSNGRA
jgi:diguanylate cyclase (GGDEF)-like protein